MASILLSIAFHEILDIVKKENKNPMHPSTGILLAKGFKHESLREVLRFINKVTPFSYFELEGRTHAISGIGESFVADGSIWPGPDFTEVDLSN